MSDPTEETTENQTSAQEYKLPEVDSFEGCNQNFANLSEFVSAAFAEMRESRAHNQKNLERLTEEANANISALANDMKSILNSHTTMFTLCIVALAVISVFMKGAADAISRIFG